jgi:hypothetical protein
MNYFTNCSSPAEAKARYRDLAMKFHPDHGGDTATMQAINAQYHEILKHLDGHSTMGTDQKPHTYHYNPAYEQAIIDKINELIKAGLHPSIQLEILGAWLWISNTKKEDQYTRLILKNAKCVWHSKREKWYYRPPEYNSHYHSSFSYEDLRTIYGATTFDHPSDDKPQVNQ